MTRAVGRTLVIGAGSGRDIASAVLAMDIRSSAPTDLAGFLTPWAWHRFDGAPERPVNGLGTQAVKFLPGRPGEPLDSFFEPHLPRVLRDCQVDVQDIYLFSLQYGTAAIEAAFQKLVHDRGYERILAVDVGGDILARSRDFGSVLTPLIDFVCLDLLGKLPASISVELAVVSPGACGEIPSASLDQILGALEHAGAVRTVEPYTSGTPAYQRFVRINEELERLTTARSHTFRVIVDTASTTNQPATYCKDFVKTYRIGDASFPVPFPVAIEPHLQNQMWMIDLRRTREALDRPELRFANIAEAFVAAKRAALCGTEVDCSLITVDPSSGGLESTVCLLTPCCYAKGDLRREIIHAGLNTWVRGQSMPAVLLRADAEGLSVPGLDWWDAGDAFRIAAAVSAHGRASQAARVFAEGGRPRAPSHRTDATCSG